MLEVIMEKDLPKDLKPLKLKEGTFNTEGRIYTNKSEFFKLYHVPKSLIYATDFMKVKEANIPYAHVPNYFIMNENNQISGEVQEFILNSHSLDDGIEIYKEKRDLQDRIPKMKQLALFTKGLDENGYFHNDFHMDNFLEDENRIYAIDLGRLQKRNNEGEHRFRYNIILLSYLFGMTERTAIMLLNEYRSYLDEYFAFAPEFLNYLKQTGVKTDIYADEILDSLLNHEEEVQKVHKLCN